MVVGRTGGGGGGGGWEEGGGRAWGRKKNLHLFCQESYSTVCSKLRPLLPECLSVRRRRVRREAECGGGGGEGGRW